MPEEKEKFKRKTWSCNGCAFSKNYDTQLTQESENKSQTHTYQGIFCSNCSKLKTENHEKKDREDKYFPTSYGGTRSKNYSGFLIRNHANQKSMEWNISGWKKKKIYQPWILYPPKIS